MQIIIKTGGAKGNKRGRGRESKGGGERDPSCHGHLGSNSPLALQLCLVLVEGLLSAIFHIRARVVFRKTMLERRGKRDSLRGREADCTYVAAEVRGAVGAMTDNPEDCGGAGLITFELAAFLSWHSWRDEGQGQGGLSSGGGWLVGE